MKRLKQIFLPVFWLIFLLTVSSCGSISETSHGESAGGLENKTEQIDTAVREEAEALVEELPEYSGEPYTIVADNEPDFSDSELQTEAYEEYSELDELGRCGTAKANIGEELMPTEDRESISEIKPSGWINKEYDDVDGGYLYNRCHLIGFQLTAENANEENLITGTRYMNTEGMLPFENMVADYIKETDNHVLYEVTPVFEDDNLVASGVLMEAESVEDDGAGISFYVYVYNVQPGIEIDYVTGESREAEDTQTEAGTENGQAAEETYILNTNTMKFHEPDCASVGDMKASNTREYSGSREDVIQMGYDPCGRCRP